MVQHTLKEWAESTTEGPSVHLNIDNSATGHRRPLPLFNEQAKLLQAQQLGPGSRAKPLSSPGPDRPLLSIRYAPLFDASVDAGLSLSLKPPNVESHCMEPERHRRVFVGGSGLSHHCKCIQLAMLRRPAMLRHSDPSQRCAEIWRAPLVQVRPG